MTPVGGHTDTVAISQKVVNGKPIGEPQIGVNPNIKQADENANLEEFKAPQSAIDEFTDILSDPERKEVILEGESEPVDLSYDANETGDPIFLKHAEFASLYNLWEANGKQPLGDVVMQTDRPACSFENGCQENLDKTLDIMGIDTLQITNGNKNGERTLIMTPGRTTLQNK